MGGQYDVDVLEWSEHQARLLRHLAEGRAGNERPDWDNIIEEIESVGRSELRSVQSLLVLAFLHDLKCEAWPHSRDVPNWRSEARLFRSQASRSYTPSMRGRIDLTGLLADALRGLPSAMDGVPAGPTASTCPATLDEAFAGLEH